MGISSIRRCQSSHREGLCGPATRLATPRHVVVRVQTPLGVNLVGAPRGPAVPTSPLWALPAGEETYFLIHLPAHEAQVAACVAPSEVVHPAPHHRIDDH